MSGRRPYGGFWRRVGAYLIDAVPLFLAQAILYPILAQMVEGSRGAASPAGPAFTVLWACVVVAGPWLYFSLMESSVYQATLGKMVLGLVVTDLEGGRISFARASVRYFGKFLSQFVFDLGFLAVALTPRRQGLHDLLAGTVVLRTVPAADAARTLIA